MGRCAVRCWTAPWQRNVPRIILLQVNVIQSELLMRDLMAQLGKDADTVCCGSAGRTTVCIEIGTA